MDELQELWQGSEHDQNSKFNKEAFFNMIKLKSHPELMRIRIKMIVEIVSMLLLLAIYFDAFDGAERPFWLNILFVISIIFYVLSDVNALVQLSNPIRGNNLLLSLSSFKKVLYLNRNLNLISSFIFSIMLWLYFMFVVDFDNLKVIMASGMVITFIVLMYLSFKLWNNRIKKIEESITDLND
ncbi:hypothetical protein [Marinigracilibium pacificum]|uniref:Uncharacterized protein n=1 Tax=Marinigracilibium pacificum TaxID=2729599 RepID=A0A848IYT6_9BACT|nr:hypothetical protein [Marinigracilibium pacificum]NMM48501.1 hypothetical protein [Marinigracilibium pacificum]